MATKNTKQQTVYHSRLRQQYEDSYRAELKKELKLDNIHQVPRLQKVSINVGLGRSKDDKPMKQTVTTTLRKITGQNPIETMAKKSIASFKIRAGQNVIGQKVTLRGDYMYEFLDRLINVVLPRLRDFRGVSLSAFDGSGNYSIGLNDQSVFPELSFEDTQKIHGLQVNIITSSNDKKHSRALLSKFGMPFEKDRAEGKEQ